MKWVLVWRVPPPAGVTISVRTGASVCFAYYSRILDAWKMVANGTEEDIAAPDMWFCDDEYAKEHQRDLSFAPLHVRNPLRLRKRKAEQLSLL